MGADSSGWNARLGAAAERHAARMLRDAGLQLLERRYRRAGGEADLVAREGETLVFVEVKARRGAGFGDPLQAVDRGKQRRIVTAARRYLHEHGGAFGPVRFDVVAVRLVGGRARVEWLRDAFRP